MHCEYVIIFYTYAESHYDHKLPLQLYDELSPLGIVSGFTTQLRVQVQIARKQEEMLQELVNRGYWIRSCGKCNVFTSVHLINQVKRNTLHKWG